MARSRGGRHGYRLAAHLGSAFLLYVGMVWVALGIGAKPIDSAALAALQQSKRWPAFRALSSLTALLVFTTAMSGAFVAGMYTNTQRKEKKRREEKRR